MLLSFISSFLRIMPKIRRFPFFSAAAVLALTVPLSALADYPDLPPEPPRAASSFIGMGAATGTPSGDVAQAVKPVLRSLPVPTMVQSAPFNKSDLYAVPVTTNFPRPLKIGVQASLGLSSRAQWLRFTLEELKYVLGEANLEILWFDGSSNLASRAVSSTSSLPMRMNSRWRSRLDITRPPQVFCLMRRFVPKMRRPRSFLRAADVSRQRSVLWPIPARRLPPPAATPWPAGTRR